LMHCDKLESLSGESFESLDMQKRDKHHRMACSNYGQSVVEDT
jgi:hypothetical protein